MAELMKEETCETLVAWITDNFTVVVGLPCERSQTGEPYVVLGQQHVPGKIMLPGIVPEAAPHESFPREVEAIICAQTALINYVEMDVCKANLITIPKKEQRPTIYLRHPPVLIEWRGASGRAKPKYRVRLRLLASYKPVIADSVEAVRMIRRGQEARVWLAESIETLEAREKRAAKIFNEMPLG